MIPSGNRSTVGAGHILLAAGSDFEQTQAWKEAQSWGDCDATEPLTTSQGCSSNSATEIIVALVVENLDQHRASPRLHLPHMEHSLAYSFKLYYHICIITVVDTTGPRSLHDLPSALSQKCFVHLWFKRIIKRRQYGKIMRTDSRVLGSSSDSVRHHL